MAAVTAHAERRSHGAPVVSLRQPPTTNVANLQTRCATCNLRELCLPCGLSGVDAARAEELIYTRKHVKRGDSLYRAGDPFLSLEAWRLTGQSDRSALQDASLRQTLASQGCCSRGRPEGR